MNDDNIQDLKQFIATTLRQETTTIREDVSRLEAKLDKKIDDKTLEILDAIGETTNTRFEAVETDVVDLDRRATKLETANS